MSDLQLKPILLLSRASINVLLALVCGIVQVNGNNALADFQLPDLNSQGSMILPSSCDSSDLYTTMRYQLFTEVNLARTNPSLYADIVKDVRSRSPIFDIPPPPDFLVPPGKLEGLDRIMNNDEIRARNTKEAIDFLQAQRPLPALKEDKYLLQSACQMVKEQGAAGSWGHDDPSGRTIIERIKRVLDVTRATGDRYYYGENIAYGYPTARVIVVEYIVDDSWPERGHRVDMFNPLFVNVGTACGAHKGFRQMCVQDFFSDYR